MLYRGEEYRYCIVAISERFASTEKNSSGEFDTEAAHVAPSEK